MLVEQASTYQEAIRAVFEHAKTMGYVGALQIEAMPLIAFVLVLANRSGLTDAQIPGHVGHHDDLRAMAEQGTEGADIEVQVAGWWILRWLDEPIVSEMAHKNMVLEAGFSFLV